MDLLWTKIITVVIFLVVSLFFGLLPLWAGPRMEKKKFLRNQVTSVLLCFGGGVLMATCFSHLLPEVIASFESVEATANKPIGEIMFCAGFFLIYFVEELVHRTLDRKKESNEVEADRRQSHVVHKSFTTHAHTCEDGKDSDDETTSSDVSVKRTLSDIESDVGSFVQKDKKQKLELNATTLRDFVTVLALSLHSVFEGLVVGLESTAEGVWTLFGAIAAHKFIVSFCIGLEIFLAKETPTVWYVIYMATFAAMTPLGIVIGTVVSENATDSDGYVIAVAVLQGMQSQLTV